MSTDNLDALTDAQLSEVFAVEVAGFKKDADGWFVPPLPRRIALLLHELPPFATSADAVLPHANKRKWWVQHTDNPTEPIRVRFDHDQGPCAEGKPEQLARLFSIALIRAKRAEKGGAS